MAEQSTTSVGGTARRAEGSGEAIGEVGGLVGIGIRRVIGVAGIGPAVVPLAADDVDRALAVLRQVEGLDARLQRVQPVASRHWGTGGGLDDGEKLALERAMVALRPLAQPGDHGIGGILDGEGGGHGGDIAPIRRHFNSTAPRL